MSEQSEPSAAEPQVVKKAGRPRKNRTPEELAAQRKASNERQKEAKKKRRRSLLYRRRKLDVRKWVRLRKYLKQRNVDTKIGRKAIELTDDRKKLIELLAMTQHSNREISLLMGFSVATLTDRFSELLEKGRADGISRGRQKLYKMGVQEGNLGALIFWLKNHAGMSDKTDIHVTNDGFEEGSPMRTFLDIADQPIPGRPQRPQLPASSRPEESEKKEAERLPVIDVKPEK